jgi:pyruvate,water dikinase
MPAYTIPLGEVTRGHERRVGTKGSVLGELHRAGFPIPAGFCVTVQSFQEFLDHNPDLAAQIRELLGGEGATEAPDPEGRTLEERASQIRRAILEARIPSRVEGGIVASYRKLCGRGDAYVACRSSAVHEDTTRASFAGQYTSCLNVRGVAPLLRAVRTCWAGVYNHRAILYRRRHSLSSITQDFGVLVQRMVESEKSGILFTAHPVTSEDVVVIESSYGLCDTVVAGRVEPDRYFLTHPTGGRRKELGSKRVMSFRVPEGEGIARQKKVSLVVGGKRFRCKVLEIEGETLTVETPEELRGRYSLSDEEAARLAEIGLRIQDLLKKPQNIEWTIGVVERSRGIYILQSRPIIETPPVPPVREPVEATVLVRGLGVSPGRAQGRAYVASDPWRANSIGEGDILVSRFTTPEYLPGMMKSGAVVTEGGTLLDHTTIVSRELGIPCVINADGAIQKIGEGTTVLVDGEGGEVYEGTSMGLSRAARDVEIPREMKLFTSLSVPSMASWIHAHSLDGILLKMEFQFSRLWKPSGETPFDELFHALTSVAKAFPQKPVVLRSLHFRGDEIDFLGIKGDLDGGPGSAFLRRSFREKEAEMLERALERGYRNIGYLLDDEPGGGLEGSLRVLKDRGLDRKTELRLLISLTKPIDRASEIFPLCDGFSIDLERLLQTVLKSDQPYQRMKDGLTEGRIGDARRVARGLLALAGEKERSLVYCVDPGLYRLFSGEIEESGVRWLCVPLEAVPAFQRRRS